MADHKRPPVTPPSGYAKDRPSGYANDTPKGYAANLPARHTVSVAYPTGNSGIDGKAKVSVSAPPWERGK